MDRAGALNTLGLKAGASQQEVRRAYLDLVNVWHPDRFANDARLQAKAAEQLRAIVDAYAFLNSKAAEAPTNPAPASHQAPNPGYATGPTAAPTAPQWVQRPGVVVPSVGSRPLQCVRCGHFGPVRAFAYWGLASWSFLLGGICVAPVVALVVAIVIGQFEDYGHHQGAVFSFLSTCVGIAVAGFRLANNHQVLEGKCARCNNGLGRIDR